MSKLVSNNIDITYNSNDWDEGAGRIKENTETFCSILSVFLYISIVVLVPMLSDNVVVVLTLGIILGMMTLIVVQALAEKVIFGNTIAGYRFLTWFSRHGDGSTAVLNDDNLELTWENKKIQNVNIGNMLNYIGCNKYNIDKANSVKSNQIKVEIDATNKEKMSIRVMSESK